VHGLHTLAQGHRGGLIEVADSVERTALLGEQGGQLRRLGHLSLKLSRALRRKGTVSEAGKVTFYVDLLAHS
jgi:hypothetical protein